MKYARGIVLIGKMIEMQKMIVLRRNQSEIEKQNSEGGSLLRMLRARHFEQAEQTIVTYGRPLEIAWFNHYFNEQSQEHVVLELSKYQNDDGGFGHGLESDFRAPISSPMATSVGLRHLNELSGIDATKPMIEAAIHYLENTYDTSRNGWFAVSKDSNDFPHAFWWHYDETENMTMIDRNWGNPSAEIIAYLYKYREYTARLDTERLVEDAIQYMNRKPLFNSENEIYCFIRLFDVVPEAWRMRLESGLIDAVGQVIDYEEERWHEYVPTPLSFMCAKTNNRFGINERKLDAHLHFVMDELERHGKILPPWGKTYYETDLNQAYPEWIGVLTLKALLSLRRFDRLEPSR